MHSFKLLFWLFQVLGTPGLNSLYPTTNNPDSIRATLLVAPEICDNGIDDDGDGYIDLFDPDCPCSTDAYQAYCPIDCEYLPDTFPAVSLSLKWQTEIIVNQDHEYPNIIVGDINQDGITDVITKKLVVSGGTTNGVLIFNGTNGIKSSEIQSIPRNNTNEGIFVSMADVDADGLAEFFFTRGDTIICMRQNGTALWKSDRDNNAVGYLVNLADFNGDGIPEVYRGSTIFNARTGKMLAQGNSGSGCNLYQAVGDCGVAHSIAADLLPSPRLELAAGNTVYQINITNTNGTAGNTMTAIDANSPVKDGFTSVGDIDGDEQLDVIVVRNRAYANGGGVWVWNPRTRAIIASAAAGVTGGVAFVGNVYGDCTPEIGVNFEDELIMYRYDGTTSLKILYDLPTTDHSGYTGVTMFDFNQDGYYELVYRDESYLRIMEGHTGTTLTSYRINNGTGMEYPVVADVDADGQAEILVSGYTTTYAQQRLYCFESGSAPWAPARNVWNQPGYHVTNINDDLTIPRNPQNQAKALIGYQNCLLPTCPAPYNSFVTQATYRTQEGCVQFPAPDFVIHSISLECLGDSVNLCFSIENTGDAIPSGSSISVTAWNSNPLHALALPVFTKDVVLTPALHQVDTFCVHIPADQLTSQVFTTANDPGDTPSPLQFPLTSVIECNYLNNLDSLPLTDIEVAVDAGPDITACLGDVVEITLPGHYDWIQWSPALALDCDTCRTIHLQPSAPITLMVTAGNGSCAGMDTISINVTFPVSVESDTLLCEGQIFLFQDSMITSGGTYWFQQSNCDTAFTWHVSILPLDTTRQSMSICAGDSLWFDGTWIKQPGSYLEHTLNQMGCDSLISLTLTIEAYLSKSNAILLCEGDSAWVYTRWVYGGGIFMDTLQGASCDTIARTVVTQTSTYDISQDLHMCPGDSVWLDGHWITDTEVVVEHLHSVTGCDSTVTTRVAVPSPPLPPQLTYTCDPPEVTAAMTPSAGWVYTWNDGAVEDMHVYHTSGPGFVTATHTSGCNLVFDFTVDDIPDLAVLNLLGDTTILEQTALQINLPISPAYWAVQWSPKEIFLCDTCLKTSIRPIQHTEVDAVLSHVSGCSYVLEFTVDLVPVVHLYIPNVFSPNGDQANDLWIVQSPGDRLTILEAHLFDRWGDELKKWTQVKRLEWDGQFHGKLLNPGVFAYSLRYLDQEGIERAITGNVTLVR